jgi:hypothetical protein
MEIQGSVKASPRLFMSELVPHRSVAKILSDNGLWQLTLREIISNRDSLKGGSYWLRDEEKLPPHGSYEITDLKNGTFRSASKKRRGILQWDVILQVEKYHDPHGPMSIEVCGETGKGKLIVTEAERWFEEFSGVVGRKPLESSTLSSNPVKDNEFLEITFADGSKKNVYDAREVKFIRMDMGAEVIARPSRSIISDPAIATQIEA